MKYHNSSTVRVDSLSEVISGIWPPSFLPCFLGNNPYKRNNLLVFPDQRSRVDKKASYDKGTIFSHSSDWAQASLIVSKELRHDLVIHFFDGLNYG